MKKQIIIALVLSTMHILVNAQTNIQVLYDFASDRGFVTSTLEGFYNDNFGSTYFFIDYDYSPFGQNTACGPQSSYMEVARGINLWRESNLGALSAHIEYNGGIGFGNSNWLFGAEYFLHNEDYSHTFTIELLYKTFNGNASSDLPLQFTFVWGLNNIFDVEGLSFSGYADIWGENTSFWYAESNPMAYNTGKFIISSEPQLWYNLGKHIGINNLNVGGEIELSYNFAGSHGLRVRPCLGLKWTF